MVLRSDSSSTFFHFIFFQKSNIQLQSSAGNANPVSSTDEVIDVSPAKHAKKDVQSQAKYKISPEDDTFQVNQLANCKQITQPVFSCSCNIDFDQM